MITFPLLLQRLNGQHATRWEWVFAASILALIPVVVLFLLFQAENGGGRSDPGGGEGMKLTAFLDKAQYLPGDTVKTDPQRRCRRCGSDPDPAGSRPFPVSANGKAGRFACPVCPKAATVSP